MAAVWSWNRTCTRIHGSVNCDSLVLTTFPEASHLKPHLHWILHYIGSQKSEISCSWTVFTASCGLLWENSWRENMEPREICTVLSSIKLVFQLLIAQRWRQWHRLLFYSWQLQAKRLALCGRMSPVSLMYMVVDVGFTVGTNSFLHPFCYMPIWA